MRLLVTAGPTRERIDPVRFISNYSTGTFGYEIAKEAKRRGARVTLISGPTSLEAPYGVKFIRVESALDMQRAVIRYLKWCDCLIMAAAVCDWRPAIAAKRKIKRGRAKKTLELIENPDILYEIGRRKKKGFISVGMALETENLGKNASEKLKNKKLDIIIANRLKPKSSLFGERLVDVLMMDRFGDKKTFSNKSKTELAKIILDRISNFTI